MLMRSSTRIEFRVEDAQASGLHDGDYDYDLVLGKGLLR